MKCNSIYLLVLEKWFPLQGERTHSLYFWSFQKQNREEGGGDRTQITDLSIYPMLYNILPQTTSTPPNPNLYRTQ